MFKNDRKNLKRESGAIALVTVLAVGFVSLIIALSVSLAGLGELQMGLEEIQSAESYRLAESCLEEAALRLKRDASYSGGSLSMGGNSCTITVLANGSQRTVNVSADVNNHVRKIEMVADIVTRGLNVTSWQEKID